MMDRAIVLGAPRSGTSFLMSVLDGLPAAECVSGNLLPVGIAHLAAQPLSEEMREALERSFRVALADYLTSGAYNARSAALRKWWAVGHPPAGLLTAARGKRVQSMLVYKEPFLAFAPELPYRALANAPILYIFRDGRDVADSLVRSYDVLSDRKLADLESNEVHMGRRVGDRYVPWWVANGEEDAFLGISPYLRALWMWREMVRRCERILSQDEVERSRRVLRVRYEDLMRTPLEQGKRLTTHLGLTPTRASRRRLGEAHERSIGIYRNRERDEIDAAERLAGEELTMLGYTLRTPAAGAHPATATAPGAREAVVRESR